MTLTTYPDNRSRLESPGDTEETLEDNNSRLSHEEFRALADELADKFMEFIGPDFQPLSDYAVSREGIYEDHLRHKFKGDDLMNPKPKVTVEDIEMSVDALDVKKAADIFEEHGCLVVRGLMAPYI